jgi:peptide deformylase
MAILKIARMGHPVLKRRADPVEDPTDPEITRLIKDMEDTLADVGGVGLAAPQVHVPLRVVIFHVPKARMEAEDGEGPAIGVPLTYLINPIVEPMGEPGGEPGAEDMEEGIEACLSVPGLAGSVPRFRRIRYRGVTPTGEQIDRIANGFHARVVQHECDHLDGVLYPMRMTDLSKLSFVEELKRFSGEVAED